MQKRVLMVVATSALFVSSSAFAAAGDWVVRVRAVNVDPQSSSSPLTGVDVSSEVIPEIDFNYFFTDNVAVKLVLTYPQKHDVTLNGAPLGTLKELPPTLMLQYHFMHGSYESSFGPYVGAGVNYTRFSSVNLTGLDVDRNSTGGALQVGFDIPINKKLSFNVDLKKLWMKTDIKNSTTGAYVTTLKIDPVLFGVGLGWKF